MTPRALAVVLALVATVAILGASVPAHAQDADHSGTSWKPVRLADGQPDIQGMWNNVDASSTPLELPDGFSGPVFSEADLQAIAEARAEAAAQRASEPSPPDVGAYAAYWFDSYWHDSDGDAAAAIIVEPNNGQIPDWTAPAHEVRAHNFDHLHDSYAFMESGDRCITRGVLGMMMPTVYNNGTLILQPPGYVVIHSEMVHRARIIPIDGRPHLDGKVGLWEGDPRGRWEGNTLVVESTNFRKVRSMRGATPGIRSRQSERQRLVERFTVVDQNTLRYSVHVEDPDTYTAPWGAAFPWTRDPDYQQFEYACHEGNYSVPNALSGARFQERSDR